MKHFKILALSLSVLFFSRITIAQTLPNHITIQVPRPDGQGLVTMELDKYNVRDKNHCKFYLDQQSYTQAADPAGADPSNFREFTLDETSFPVRTYRGYVPEEPNSQVIAVIWPGRAILETGSITMT